MYPSSDKETRIESEKNTGERAEERQLDGGNPFNASHGLAGQRISRPYTEYVKHKYRDVIVVFYGNDCTNTKDMTHQRRSKGNAGTTVTFTAETIVSMKKEPFLTNMQNKQRFIVMLREELKKNKVL